MRGIHARLFACVGALAVAGAVVGCGSPAGASDTHAALRRADVREPRASTDDHDALRHGARSRRGRDGVGAAANGDHGSGPGHQDQDQGQGRHIGPVLGADPRRG